MESENPYAASDASDELPRGPAGSVHFLPEPESHNGDFGRGWAWIRAGFTDFGRNPLLFIGQLVLLSVALFSFSFVTGLGGLVDPVTGMLVQMVLSLGINFLIFPVSAGFLMAVRQGRAEGSIRFETFFAGFRHPRLGALFGLGGVYLVFSIATMVLMFLLFMGFSGGWLEYLSWGMDPSSNSTPVQLWWFNEDGPILIILLVFALSLLFIPVLMAFFFATHLVTFGPQGVGEALKLSFVGCLRNIVPLILWGLFAWVLAFVSIIPCGLGLLVTVPALWASTYQAFLDIYTTEGERDPRRSPRSH